MNTIAWLPSLPAFVQALGWMVLAGLLTTLYASLVVSQEAGVGRLPEKYPAATRRIRRNQQRWDTIRYAVFLSAMLCAIGGVTTALLGLPTEYEAGLAVAVVILLTALLLCVLLNVVPHALSESYADLMSVRLLPLGVFLSWLLWPLARTLALLEHRLTSWARTGADEESSPSSEEEILHLVDSATDEDLEDDERELIKSVFEFGDTVTRESMTPRVDVVGFEEGTTVLECCEQIKDSPHSRFPVYRETIDGVIGGVHVKDLMRLMSEGHGDRTVGSVAKDITFVPESLPINDLLQLLRAEKEQLAVVVDEYGGTSGLITMEDILEELVGDIHDEYDAEPFIMQRLANGAAILDARIAVDEANRLLEIDVPDSDEYDSLGGFVYHQLGRIPMPGETVDTGGTIITVQSANARQIQTVQVAKKPLAEQA